MWHKPTLEDRVEALGVEMLQRESLKAVMMSKNAEGDVVITFVEGIEDSHKVKFGKLDRRSRAMMRLTGQGGSAAHTAERRAAQSES